ncbi:MAG: UDP-3-O-(3-hydroxymyristoyl)glucosamine N-acyltransferase [Mariniblastus sp.]|nr:UDP-3-O-(3-hydroxymyristoyl)glucosamine N-acyltransferase [Mariniblastus sp.]
MRRLSELSSLVGGTVTGQPDLEVMGAASIFRAGPGEITFVTSSKYLEDFLQSDAVAAVVGCETDVSGKPCIQVENVEAAFIQIVEQFQPRIQRTKIGVSPQAIISPTAVIGDEVCIHPGAVIMDNVEIGFGSVIYPNVTVMENSRIGVNVRIFPNAVLYENTVVGDRSIIHSGAVLGAFGFGYDSSTGQHELSAQLGNVVLGDDVEVGANTTVDRGTYDSTTIGSGSKLDNLVMVGHNCVVGKHNLLCSQVGVAGSCNTGDYVVMGGQVGIGDHLSIGARAEIGAQSGVMHDIDSGQRVFGSPAIPARDEMKILANRAKLPEMRKTIKKIVKQMDQLVESQQEPSEDTRAA